MSIKTDEPNENWRDPSTREGGKPAKTVKARNRDREARESAQLSVEEREAQEQQQDRQILAAVGTQNQARVDRLGQIADRNDETRDDMQQWDGDKIIVDEESERERAAAQAAQDAETERQRLEAEAAENAARALQEEGAGPRKFKLKVNGRDMELTEAELLERAQKVESADQYLTAAAEALRRSQAVTPSPRDESPRSDEDDPEQLLVSALQGEQEAIKKVAARLKKPAVTPDVLQALDDRMSFREAVSRFRAEYKDLVEDPRLFRMVSDEDARLAREQPTLPYDERLKRAGESVRTWKQSLAPAPQAQTPKLARKASVAPVPQAGGRQQAQEDEEESESVESVIDKMAQARRQTAAIRKVS